MVEIVGVEIVEEVPVLMTYFIRGRIRDESENPLNRVLIRGYQPVLRWALAHPWGTLGGAVLLVVVTAWPVSRLGSEFLPPLYEGDLLYMPTTLPGISPAKAAELLQQTDRIIKTFPEVHHVFGKIGRAGIVTTAGFGDSRLAGRPQVGDPAGLAVARVNEPATVELEHGDRDGSRLARAPTAHRKEHVRSTGWDPCPDHPAGERVEETQKPAGHPIPGREADWREIIGCHGVVPRRRTIVVALSTNRCRGM